MVRLEIYIEAGCFACLRSVHIAEHVRQRFPQVEVRLVDMSDPDGEVPELVTASPTFLLNGQIFCLGNPKLEALEQAILDLIRE